MLSLTKGKSLSDGGFLQDRLAGKLLWPIQPGKFFPPGQMDAALSCGSQQTRPVRLLTMAPYWQPVPHPQIATCHSLAKFGPSAAPSVSAVRKRLADGMVVKSGADGVPR